MARNETKTLLVFTCCPKTQKRCVGTRVRCIMSSYRNICSHSAIVTSSHLATLNVKFLSRTVSNQDLIKMVALIGPCITLKDLIWAYSQLRDILLLRMLMLTQWMSTLILHLTGGQNSLQVTIPQLYPRLRYQKLVVPTPIGRESYNTLLQQTAVPIQACGGHEYIWRLICMRIQWENLLETGASIDLVSEDFVLKHNLNKNVSTL